MKVEVTMTHYLAGAITLSQAAELLDIPMLDLRVRLLRLDVPLRETPAEAAEAAEADKAKSELEPGVIWLISDHDL